jgi:hypothetical protein
MHFRTPEMGAVVGEDNNITGHSGLKPSGVDQENPKRRIVA